METAPTQHMTLIVLSGALLAAVAAAIVIYLLPSSSTELAETPLATDQSEIATTTQESSTQFNTSVLERSEYKDLDASLFVRGLLPVQPPTGTGKTNLFQ